MAKSNIDISINITAHQEGLLLYKTLRGVLVCREAAENKGISTEINISLDISDTKTINIAERFANEHKGVNVFSATFGDPASSRNLLISKSSGKYIAFFDGDDFFGEDYLYRAFTLAEKSRVPAIYVAELIVYFGAENVIKQSLDFNSPHFHPINLFETNYFVSSNFVPRSIYEQIPYQDNGLGYGMEDWHWNTRVIDAGYEFHNIPDTIFFYRRSAKNSMLHRHLAANVTLHSTPYFAPDRFLRQSVYKIDRSVSATPEVTSLGLRVRKSTVRALRKVMSNESIPYRYIREQYHMNRGYAAALKASLKSGKKTLPTNGGINADFYFDTTAIIPDIPERLQLLGLTEKHVKQWANLNLIEPLIRPSKGIFDTIEIAGYLSQSPLSVAYYEFCEKYRRTSFSDLIFIPHLVHGGADLAIINLVKALSELNKKVLVVATEHIESPWAEKVSGLPGVELVEFYKDFSHLDEQQMQTFWLRFIQQWNPGRLSIINSVFAYRLLEKYGLQIREHTDRVYLYTYAFDMTPDGYLFNAIPNGLVDVYPYVDLFLTDSKGYMQQLDAINGFEPEKVHEVYLPVQSLIEPKQESSVTRKVLWASRVSPAKLMEVAVEIGKLLADEGIELHFYGSLDAVYDLGDRFKRMLKDLQNVRYHGTYDGFASLPLDKYDLFLLTTKNEGMPNVILEALMADLFVIAPPVGGIPEVVQDEKNGFLVEDKFNAQAYVDSIKAYYAKPKLHDLSLRAKTNRRILEQHSWSAFKKRLEKLYDF